MKRIYLVPFLLLLPCFLAAQNTDSGQYKNTSVSQTQQKAKERLNTLKDCFNEFDYDAFYQEYDDFIAFTQKHNLQNEMFEAFSIYISFLEFRQEYDKAIEATQEMYNLAKAKSNTVGLYFTTSQFGSLYCYMDRMEDAESYLFQALGYYKRATADIDPANTYINLITVLGRQKKYVELEKILLDFRAVNDMYVQTKGHDAAQNRSLTDVEYINLYLELGNFQKAKCYADTILTYINQLPANYRGHCNNALMLYYGMTDGYEKGYKIALEMEKFYEQSGNSLALLAIIKREVKFLALMGKGEQSNMLFEKYLSVKDSLNNIEYNARLDDLRTQYEVDKHIVEKQRNRDYFLFALGGCMLLAIALGIWVYYSRQILRKNRELIRKARQWANVAPVPAIEDAGEETVSEKEIAKASDPNEMERLLFTEIEQLIDNGLYVESNLSLEMLAGKTNQNPTYISKAVSRCTGKTFKTWLNEYRIKEAVRLLSDKNNPNISIETVAWDSGFNDRKTFHRIFKQTTGLSPSDFKKSGLRK